MSEFINLEDSQNESLIVNVPAEVSVITNSSDSDLDIIAVDKIDTTVDAPSDDSLCVKGGLDCTEQYGCKDPTGYFTVDNLFSELTDDHQRETAKRNLGIGSPYTLIWGNISGNLVNQKDLYNFVLDKTNESGNSVIDQINLKLSELTTNVNVALNAKANIYSPVFTGNPQAPTQLATDKSTNIANTEWVTGAITNAKLAGNLRSIAVDPMYAFYGDTPINITVYWDYLKNVTAQTLNGVSIDVSLRQYTFTNVNGPLSITLAYVYDGISESRVVNFVLKYPIYYGVSNDYTKLSKTITSPFSVTAGDSQYIYVLIPNGSSSSLMVNSIIGGFTLLGTQVLYNNIYYIYRSDIAGLGTTTIEIVDSSTIETNVMNTATVLELLNTKADSASVPTRISQLTNDSKYVTGTPYITTTNTAIDPNKFYVFGNVESLNITLNTPMDNSILNKYMFQFYSGDIPTVLTLPSTVRYTNGNTISANKTYQVTILNNLVNIIGA